MNVLTASSLSLLDSLLIIMQQSWTSWQTLAASFPLALKKISSPFLWNELYTHPCNLDLMFILSQTCPLFASAAMNIDNISMQSIINMII